MRGILVLSALLAACASGGPSGSGSSGGQEVDAGGGGGNGGDDDDGSATGPLGGVDAAVDSMPDAAPALQTATFVVKVVGGNYWRGWISKSGTSSGHTPTLDNTFTGETSPGNDLDSYMVFALTGVTASQVVDATLHLQVEGFQQDNVSTETVSIWDVTTPSDQVENTAGSVAIHDDLETGIKYGTFPVKATDVSTDPNTYLTIPLNADAVAGIKAHLGQDFTIGMSMDTVPGYVLFSSNSEVETHELVIHYLP